MEYRFIFLIIFLNSLFLAFSVVQQWNFDNSAIDILASSDSASIKVIEETTDGLFVKLYKYLAKEGGSVVYRKYLTVSYYGSSKCNDLEVNFDKIGSYHHFEDDTIICPKGKYNPHYVKDNAYSTLDPTSLSGFNDNGDWELKCFTHEQGYFIVVYLMNGQPNFYYKSSGGGWGKLDTHQEIYDMKMGIKLSNNDEYALGYLVKTEDKIKLLGAKYTIKPGDIRRNDCGAYVEIMDARTY